jgi:AraC family transcriptional regulator
VTLGGYSAYNYFGVAELSNVQVMGPGVFFGKGRRELQTSSFEFAEMNAAIRDVPRHTHLNAHFVLVVRGVYLTAAMPDEGPCGADTLIFNPSGTTHRDRFQSAHGKFFTISVAPELAVQIERKIQSPISFNSGTIAKTIRRAYFEFQDHTDFSPMIMEGLGLELSANVSQSQDLPDRHAPAWLKTARDLIHDSRGANLRVKDVARVAGVHPIHLARVFRRYFQCSPGEYARRCRIQNVRRLLCSKSLPLAEIALLSGFADQSQLTHSFKQFTGVTPGAFRRNCAV